MKKSVLALMFVAMLPAFMAASDQQNSDSPVQNQTIEKTSTLQVYWDWFLDRKLNDNLDESSYQPNCIRDMKPTEMAVYFGIAALEITLVTVAAVYAYKYCTKPAQDETVQTVDLNEDKN